MIMKTRKVKKGIYDWDLKIAFTKKGQETQLEGYHIGSHSLIHITINSIFLNNSCSKDITRDFVLQYIFIMNLIYNI